MLGRDPEAPAVPGETTPAQRPDLDAVEEDGAPRRALLARDDVEQRRLAGAARAEDHGQLSRLDLEGEIHERLDTPTARAPVDLGDAPELQHGSTVIIGSGVGRPGRLFWVRRPGARAGHRVMAGA